MKQQKRIEMLNIAIGLTSLTIATGAVAHPLCELMPDGSFDKGKSGWQLMPEQVLVGDAGGFADAEIIDGTTYFGLGVDSPFDSSVLRLTATAVAGAGLLPGDSVLGVTATQSVVVNGPFLRYVIGGSFEFQFFGLGDRRIEAFVSVLSADGDEAVGVIYDSGEAVPQPICGFGLSVLGTFDTYPPEMYVNLAAAGVEPGDTATISITLRASAGALVDCQDTISSAVLLVDDLSFCDRAPIVGDLNGDGVVDGIDLGILLSNWSIPAGSPGCSSEFPCPSDLNQDAHVDGLDLGMLLSNWSVAA